MTRAFKREKTQNSFKCRCFLAGAGSKCANSPGCSVSTASNKSSPEQDTGWGGAAAPCSTQSLLGWDIGWQQGIADEVNHGICISCKFSLWEGSSHAVRPPRAACSSGKNKYIFHEELHLNHLSSLSRWGFLSCLECDLLHCLAELAETTHYRSICAEQDG